MHINLPASPTRKLARSVLSLLQGYNWDGDRGFRSPTRQTGDDGTGCGVQGMTAGVGQALAGFMSLKLTALPSDPICADNRKLQGTWFPCNQDHYFCKCK